MANLTEQERNIIASRPLNDHLTHLREPLRDAVESLGLGPTSADSATESFNSSTTELILDLLWDLLAHEAADHLCSRAGVNDFTIEFSEVRKIVLHDRYTYKRCLTLAQLVVEHATDIDIWNAVFDLINTVIPKTPPSVMDPISFSEIKTCTYREVGGFFKKYFEGRPWRRKTDVICDTMMARYRDERWLDFPQTPTEDALWEWLSCFQETHLQDSPGVFHRNVKSIKLVGGKARRQVDVLIKKRDVISDGAVDWTHCRVIGELKMMREGNNFEDILLQVTRLVREVFANQPNRRFVHSFFLQGNMMELWVFDRSGPYSAGEFDIHKEPRKFVQALAGYAMMNDEELGLDTTTELDNGSRTITMHRQLTTRDEKMSGHEKPFSLQKGVVCRGTSCYRSCDNANVVKLSWTPEERTQEAVLLKCAQERGVEGIVRIIGYRRITSTKELRRGLTFGSRHKFNEDSVDGSTSEPKMPLSNSATPMSDVNIPWTSSTLKRKHSVDTAARDNRSSLESCKNINEHDSETEISGQDNGYKFSNRVYSCLAISPAGQTLGEFGQELDPNQPAATVMKVLVTVLRDAIKAHYSLFLKGNILHRNISENSIILTRTEKQGDLTGMLIDLELAVEINERSRAEHLTGAVEFMAIGVLLGDSHTYRHDLESFFWVLIWFCVCHARTDLAPNDGERFLIKWNTGTFEQMADEKLAILEGSRFQRILNRFPPGFEDIQTLCKKLRSILFPLRSQGPGKLEGWFFGTPENHEDLYSPVQDAFNIVSAHFQG